MKIYKKIIFDKNNIIIFEDSYNYIGPLSECGIHYNFKSTRSAKAMEKKARREKKLADRRAKKQGTLNPTRIQKLESEGFSWDPLEDAWHEMYLALKEYKSIHGDCNVPQSHPDNPQLGMWVGTQRTLKKQSKLSQDKVGKLESEGFSWA